MTTLPAQPQMPHFYSTPGDARFSERKFLSLPFERRHKTAAKILRAIYENTSIGASLREYYLELAQWANWTALDLSNTKEIADRYHWHITNARFHLREHNLLPPIRKGDRERGAEPLPIAIYLDNIRSAHNVGSIVRTTEAFSLGSLYFSDTMAFTDHKQVQDAAMGAQEWIPCRRGHALRELPGPVILLETSPQAQSIYQYHFPDQFTLVIGNEEYGCSEESLKLASALVEIPMAGRKNSLNVANAYAIAASEIHRQKRIHL